MIIKFFKRFKKIRASRQEREAQIKEIEERYGIRLYECMECVRRCPWRKGRKII